MQDLMSEEHAQQHEFHERQCEALDEMWRKRTEAVSRDARERDEMLQAENSRLRSSLRQEKIKSVEDLRKLAQSVKDHVVAYSHNGSTSVPFLLHHLEKITNGLVEHTAYPVGATHTPEPLAQPVKSKKRVFGSEETKSVMIEGGCRAVKRSGIALEDDAPTAARLHL
eukprot:TRINITY_DN19791_c0_g1_i1.p2 TRINITY_DN19791_c0_g1~~TRINITY_DN19791_c0_g1_i1.p2  ORF type:complete len:168 (+),score=43.97 TRINITY_DN19791_c0_g1_i1:115-618(+)